MLLHFLVGKAFYLVPKPFPYNDNNSSQEIQMTPRHLPGAKTKSSRSLFRFGVELFGPKFVKKYIQKEAGI